MSHHGVQTGPPRVHCAPFRFHVAERAASELEVPVPSAKSTFHSVEASELSMGGCSDRVGGSQTDRGRGSVVKALTAVTGGRVEGGRDGSLEGVGLASSGRPK